LNARIALSEVQRAAGQSLPLNTSGNLPKVLNADVAIDMDDNHIKVSTARLTLGQSNVEASGTLKDVSSRQGSLRFNAKLALGELGRMLKVSSHPEGMVQIGGNARMSGNPDYLVTGNVNARGLAFQQAGHRLSGVSLDTSVRADPARIDLKGFAPGGTRRDFQWQCFPSEPGNVSSQRQPESFRFAGNGAAVSRAPSAL
jgi:autotransporter translocation and assembly factor TamB